MELPNGYMIPYNKETESAYRTIFQIAMRLAKREHREIVPSTYEKGAGDEKLLHDRGRHCKNRNEAERQGTSVHNN